MNNLPMKQTQSGAALVISLILLVVVTVLAVSGMNTATTELAMARNDQNYENAFQAAETGIETALGQDDFPTDTVTVLNPFISNNEQVTARTNFVDELPVIDSAFSLGSGFLAYHYVVTSTAESKRVAGGGTDTDRDASSQNTQAFYVVGPTSSDIL